MPRAGTALADRVRAGLPELLGSDPAPAYVWPARDTATPRALTAYPRRKLALPKRCVRGRGYRRPA